MSAEGSDADEDWCSAPLLGIALVVDDADKGQRLVFRYPALREVIRLPGPDVDVGNSSSSSNGNGAGAAGGRDSAASSASSLGPSPAAGGSKDTGPRADAWATLQCEAEFHQLSPEVFARLFRPKAQLCGRSLQVTIDRVRYVSHPVLTASATKETAKDDVLLFNIVLATARVHVRDPSASERRRRLRQLRWIRSASSSVAGEVTGGGDGGDTVGEGDGGGSSSTNGGGPECALRPLQRALDRLTKALLHEERRCRYVSREVGLLLQIRESVYGKGLGSAEEAQTMLDLMMEQSALANDLKAVFHGLKDMEGGGPGSEDPARPQLLEVAVNGWIRISLPGGRGPSASRVAGVGGGGGGLPPRIERYHTILPLLDEDELLAKLPPDGSEQLRALVRACNPLKTLDEMSAATRIAPPQLALLASHLVYWGYARVVRTITLRSVYAIKPTAPTHLGALPALAFQQRFPPHSFFRVLAGFGAGQALGALLEDLSEEAQLERLAMVVWLLQQDVIEEIDLYR